MYESAEMKETNGKKEIRIVYPNGERVLVATEHAGQIGITEILEAGTPDEESHFVTLSTDEFMTLSFLLYAK